MNSITGRDSQSQSQLITASTDPNMINEYFCSINTDPDYVSPALVDIPVDTRIPETQPHVVSQFLSKHKRTACGPDGLPYWLFRDFALVLAPVVADVFNSSLRQHKVSSFWKLADITPLPKESPLTSCSQLRPISLTAVIMRLFERLVYKHELSSICRDFIDLDQFAYREGHNSSMALIKCQHKWLSWLVGDADFVRVFSFDFSKTFDSVPHHILCSKLKQVNINLYIVNWMISLRSKRFCGFSEQRKTEERDFDNFAAQEMGTSVKMERGGRGGKELWNKKWSRVEGGGGKGNACQQRSLF